MNRIPQLDEVGPWTKTKLKLLQKYLRAYTRILKAESQAWCTGVHYIDAFAGTGIHKDREMPEELLDGSPRIALKVNPSFDRLMFIEKDAHRAEALRALKGEFPDRQIQVYEGDCNEELHHIFDTISRNERTFLLLDPYNLGVNWETIEAAANAGNGKSVEILINFSILDALLNMVRKRPELVDPKQADRLTETWGNESWKTCVFGPERTLFGDQLSKRDKVAQRLSEGFRERLRDVYEYVPKGAIMRNSRGRAIYSLIHASHVPVAKKIIQDVFEEYASA
ncbi:MAG: three-Cys-motif partner protein TcmP [Armatimonadota bacterium]